MRRRKLGRTGLALPVLGLGGAGMLMDQHYPASEHDVDALLLRAVELGVDYVDTSPAYGSRLSERRVGRVLGRTSAVISTKCGLVVEPDGSMTRDYSYAATLRSVELSLAALERTTLDLVQVHEVTEESAADALDGALRALCELKAEGVVRAVGITSSEPAALERCMSSGVLDAFMIWKRWNLLDRTGADVIAAAAASGVGVLVAAPFASGLLARGADSDSTFNYAEPSATIRQRVRLLEEASPDPIDRQALRFALRDDVTSVIAAVDHVDELERNVANIL